MKRSRTLGRSSATISNARWTAYATASAATALGCATSAEADITYSGLINQHFDAPVGEFSSAYFFLDPEHYFIPNHSGYGAAGFQFGAGAIAGFSVFRGGSSYKNYASKLSFGQNLSTRPFVRSSAILARGDGNGNSQWPAPGTGFVGFQFNGGAGLQYGWARIKMDGAPRNSFTLVDYAFGDVGDRIVAGQTALGNPPAITSPLSATVTAGQQFSYEFESTGATFRAANSLPPGLTFDATLQAILGIPTATGTFQAELLASNEFGTTTAPLTITVQPSPSSGPVIISSSSVTGRTGRPFSFQVLTSGASLAARISATGLPAGLTIDEITGLISGTPTTDGSSSVVLTVTDGNAITSTTLEITFSSDPALPVIVSAISATVTPGQPFTFQFLTDAVPNDSTTFRIVGQLPAGLMFDPATGIISGVVPPTVVNARGKALSGGVVTNIQVYAINPRGSTSSQFTLFLGVPNVGNISTRGAIGTGENVLVAGFIINPKDNAAKTVIIRGIGPSLKVNGIPLAGRVQDPILELRGADGALIPKGLNDDWRSFQEQEIIKLGDLAPKDDRESAIIAILSPGSYTATMRGKNDSVGIGLVEVYDLGSATFDVFNGSRLANLSTRGFVQNGDSVMIGGFIISGDTTKVIVRAI